MAAVSPPDRHRVAAGSSGPYSRDVADLLTKLRDLPAAGLARLGRPLPIRGRGAAVLCYHDIGTDAANRTDYYVDPGLLASHLAWVDFGEQPVPCPVAIVPGLSIESSVESGCLPDVMRGEETQVFGALRILGLANATLVHPGAGHAILQPDLVAMRVRFAGAGAQA